mmetsp:Transcript_16655/g.30282  ORF Transcript_16655/g.30282 Transcript_16655/m.30282 type:complete len:550 (+) Transcript_16655:48-1697(+)
MDAAEYLKHFSLHVQTDPIKGRGIYCDHDLEAGDAILTVEACITCPLVRWTQRCVTCLLPKEDAPSTFVVCTACNQAAFCCSECAQMDRWHQYECPALPGVARACGLGADGELEERALGLFSVILLVARVLRTIHSCSLTGNGNLSKSASDLTNMATARSDGPIDNLEQILASVLTTSDACQMLLPTAMRKRCLTDRSLVMQEIAMCHRRLKNNNFLMIDSGFSPVAAVCDPMTALINHSCEPNAMIIWQCPIGRTSPQTHVVRSLAPLKAGDEVLISYIDCDKPWWIRRASLKASHNFECGCSLCKGTSAYLQSLSSGRLSDAPAPPIPCDVSSSIATMSDAMGRTITLTLNGTQGLVRFIRETVGISTVPGLTEQIQEASSAANLVDELGDVESFRCLPRLEACQRLERLRAPARTLIRLLSSRHLLLRELFQVMLLAEVCEDWSECLFLAPYAIEALAPVRKNSMSLRFVEALTLGAIAQSMNWLEQMQKTSGPVEEADILSVFTKPLSLFQLLHGSLHKEHPRVKTMRSLLSRLELAHVFLDRMD